MKTDRELLGLAAKAAGLDLWTDEYDNLFLPDPMRRWNPLTDDGDALRLAVRLHIGIRCHGADHWQNPNTSVALYELGDSGGRVQVAHGDDPAAVTRRAIVRAAAAIQEAKEAP